MLSSPDEGAGEVRNGRSGGHLVARQLRVQGVDTVFCVPGESHLDVLDGLYDEPEVKLVVCRHEAAACNMAVADAKLTGRPGVCMVSRGPGAAHAAIGVHIAEQDSAPLVLLIGQVPSRHRGRESFQEVDYRQFFGSMAKWVSEITHPDQVPETMARAFQVAAAGRPGPVVISLPEDVLEMRSAVADAARDVVVEPAPSAASMETLGRLLARAERPIVVAGGSRWTEAATEELRRFAERSSLPVAASFRSQDVIDNRSQAYCGALGVGAPSGLLRLLPESDLVLALGTRLDDLTTGGYRLLRPPSPAQPLVHVHPEPGELGRVFQPELAINATPAAFLAAASALDSAVPEGRRDWAGGLREEYVRSRESNPRSPLDLAAVVRHLSDRMPDDTVITNGAGNYTGWVHRFHQFKRFGTQLAPVAGAMGFGVPAALAAKLRHPERPVVCYAGDGCFLMSSQELATAARYQLPVIFVVIDNASYGSIRSHQVRRYPGRLHATDITSPDFVAYARAFGCWGCEVTETAAFAPALEAALAAGQPALLHVRVDAALDLASA
ncbi:thiamine pyrophosphate-dependent enzyme [Candidatus Nephthysia bennettiae]|uniref:thiamine pyrophosphate-dependent enzyme n=1 Tax=Candidatus Nephthysia bennettiae TaxID=3127016 RepID=UPI0030C73E11